jgi:2-isopropylmalate synthase
MTQLTIQSRAIYLYDTTLRDGAQREGIALSLEDKCKIATHLDRLGFHFIEGGWPGANPKDEQLFTLLKQQPLQQAQLVAFCSTRRPHTPAHQDRIFPAILAADTQWVTIFGKSWDLQVTEGLQTTLTENLAMIADSIRYLRQQQRRVIYDAEHWFDGFNANPTYALATLTTAIAAGAEWVVLCDTNGGTLPDAIARITQATRQALHETAQSPVPEADIQIGIHAHNDSDTAVANTLAAVQAGATMVQGTINGYGERCGNANLCSIIPNLQLKMDLACMAPHQLADLTATSRLISEIVNLAPDDHAPFVGRSAFAHKGGIHVSAVQRNPATYEHLPPEWVGNRRRIVISDQAGMSNILEKAKQYGLPLTKEDPTGRQILQHVKTLESEGYQFEAAEASFELLIRQRLYQRPTFFEILGFEVSARYPQSRHPEQTFNAAIATVKIAVCQQEILSVAEGVGPVAALDAALRKALTTFYPIISEFQLTDYKVRILDSGTGTGAKTRVLVESSDGQQRWTTLGVSMSIIEASYQAVSEGIEYGLVLHQQNTCPLPNAR